MTAPESEQPNIDVQHQPERHRFVAAVDGAEGVLDYVREGDIMAITHTEVPAAIGGRGIAGQLVKAAFDHARGVGWKVRPDCSYAAAWAGRHPEYASLLG
ncbi:MAG: GNAT family N-acetyltransferase [Lysobacter sp.]